MPQNDNQNFKGRILVVDDEFHQRTILFEVIKPWGFDVSLAASGPEALKMIDSSSFDLVITDMKMPEMDGLEVISQVKARDPGVSVIVITAHGSIETAVEAMKKGAQDYLLKPIDIGELEIVIQSIFNHRELVREKKILLSENELLKRDLRLKYQVTNLIGKSEKVQKLQKELKNYLKSNAPILILGEQGVGKEEIARMIHYNGIREQHSLISFDSLSVPEEMHETQLFGNELTVSTVSKQYSKPGLVEKAHLGTLIITNCYRLNLQCQANIARVIRDEKTIRSGGTKFYQASCRIIATSEKNEFERIFQEKNMRQDFHDILRQNTIEVPSLKERKEDIPVLIGATARLVGQALGKEISQIDKAVLDKLSNYDFPGNLKELSAIIEAAVIHCSDSTLKLEHFLNLK